MYDALSNRWYAHIPIKLRRPERPSHHPTKKYDSIDLGICNIATTLYVPNKRPLIYSGRAVLSDWVYHTKRIAKLQSQLKHNNQYTSRKIRQLFRTRQRRFKHAINAMLRDLFERITSSTMHLTDLIIGDLNGIRKDNDLGARTNQKLHNFWSHNYILRRIKELGEEYNINVIKQSERGTSKTCCVCGLQHNNGRIHRGLHYCKDHRTVINADVGGAYNLYNVAVNGTLAPPGGYKKESSGSRLMAQPLMLRWE